MADWRLPAWRGDWRRRIRSIWGGGGAGGGVGEGANDASAKLRNLMSIGDAEECMRMINVKKNDYVTTHISSPSVGRWRRRRTGHT